MTRFVLPALAAALVLSACDSADPDPQPVALESETVVDLAADPTTGRNPSTGAPVQTGRYSLYSLRENRLVLSYAEADATIRQRDSASTAWDIGFQGQRLIFNGGISGPGQAAAQIVDSTFAEVTVAPASGYVRDGENTACPTGPLAVCFGSDNGWYNYNSALNLVTPLAGRTIVVRNADGATYSKVRILNYYQGNPDPSTITPASVGRYYTFEFVYQPDGSRTFETTTALQW